MAPTITIPDTAEGMHEFLTDKKKRDTIFSSDADPKDILEFQTKYANLTAKKDPELNDQLKEQIEGVWTNFVRENNLGEFRRNGEKVKLTGAEARKELIRAQRSTTAYSDQAMGKPLDGKFKTLMDYLEVIHPQSDPRESRIKNLRDALQNAMSSTDPSAGGFLIPEEFRATLMEIALEESVVRSRATVIPMASLRAAIPAIDSTTNVGSVYGGVVGYWTEEGAALTQSQPTFSRVVLEAKKITAYTEVPNELPQDSAISVEALINILFPRAIAFFEDIAFLRGTGVGEPLGVLNPLNAALVSHAMESGQAANLILWENLIGMYARMLPSSLANAVWLVPPDAFPQLATMALSVGTGGSAVWLNNGQDGPPASILGRPVIITEKTRALGTLGDVAFVDLRQYLIGDRMAMEGKVSTEYKFGNDVTAYRFIERVDGRPWMQSAITPANGSTNTLSPYVQLSRTLV